MAFTSLWPLFLLLTMPLLILLYILKRKYKEEVISSTLLWGEVYKNVSASTPWEKFRKNIMLLLQLIILLFLILALMQPHLNFGGKSYKNIILVIDNTASMGITYGETTRLERGKEIAKEIIEKSGVETNTYLLSYNGEPNLLQSGQYEKESIIQSINSINKSNNSGNIEDSFNYLKSIGQGIEEDYEVILITDKEVDLKDFKGKVISLGNSGMNGAIENMSHKILDNGTFRVIANITNKGSEVYEGDFSIYDDGSIVAVESVSLEPLETKTVTFDLSNIKSNYLRGELSKKDLLLDDNIYYYSLGNKKINKILLVTEENLFIEKSLQSIENSEVYKTNSLDNVLEENNYDLYVYDGFTPTIMPKTGSILLINPNSNEFFKVLDGGSNGLVKPVVSEVSSYLQNMEFTLGEYNTLEVPYFAKSFIKVGEDTVGIKGELEGRTIAAMSFSLYNSDFVLKKEFPILIYELSESLLVKGMTNKNNYKYSERVYVSGVSSEGEIKITTPEKEEINILGGEEFKSYKSIGVYKIENKDENETFTINYPTETESNTSISTVGEVEYQDLDGLDLNLGINLAPILIILAISVVSIEWILYKKGA